MMKNAGGEHFVATVRDLVMAELQYPGWLTRQLTHRVSGLEEHEQAFGLLNSYAIKIFVEVVPLD